MVAGRTDVGGRRAWRIGVGLALLVVGIAAVIVLRVARDPNVPLLTSAGGADWVRVDRPFDFGAYFDPPTRGSFATTIDVGPGQAGRTSTLTVTALRWVTVSIDGQPLLALSPLDADRWQTPRTIALPPLSPGPHLLRLDVGNRNGPSLVRAACPALGIATGCGRWVAGGDARVPVDRWAAAVPVDEPWVPALSLRFESAASAVRRLWPGLAVVFAVGAGAYWLATRADPRRVDWGRRVRWGVTTAMVLLAVNNVFRVPAEVGYDVASHRAYVRRVADTWRVPLPTEGWEMFHPPVYYFASAVVYRLALAAGMAVDRAEAVERVIPLACMVMMAELCRRAARAALPGRSAAQAVAAVVGGLVPVNLYMGQAVSNEPLAACFDGAVFVLCLGLLASRADEPDRRWTWRLVGVGVVLGLSAMTKVSGAAWAGAVALAAAVGTRRRGGLGIGQVARAVLVPMVVAAVVCGGYFVRNAVVLGPASLTHLTLGQGRWWQDPGFRTPSQFLPTIRPLVRPAFPNPDNVIDGLYSTLWASGELNGVPDLDHRPPWNYGLMACGLWLALIPIAAVIAGVVRAARSTDPASAPLRFTVATAALFVAALLYGCLTWPVYSAAKASYLLGTVPCLAVLAAAGFDVIPARHRLTRAVAVGGLTCWSAASYLTYWVR